jgi:hypothetical protein
LTIVHILSLELYKLIVQLLGLRVQGRVTIVAWRETTLTLR